MIQHVESVAYGRPATEALARAIAVAKSNGPLAPVTVVVGSNLVGLSLRRLLGSGALGGSGLVNVSFLTPFRLAELLAPPPEPGRRPLTNPVLGAGVRHALAVDPGPFVDVADHPATESAIADLFAEVSHVSRPTLDALIDAGGIAAVSVRLVDDVRRRLTGFVGEPELADAVLGRVDLADERARVGKVVWHLPEPVTPSLERVLQRVSAAFDTTVIAGLSGVERADRPVRDLCARLGIELDPTSGTPPPVASTIVSVTDPDAEVRAAVRHAIALAESGTRLDRIGIFYPSRDPYLHALEQHLHEAGVASNGPRRDRLSDTVAGRTLLAALALGDHQWRRDHVMALVSGAPVRNGDEPARPASWEALSRAAGVVQGLADWRAKLAGHRESLANRIRLANELDADRVRRTEHDLAAVDELARFVDGLADALRAVETARGWRDKSQATQDLLVSLLGPEPRHQIWPEPEQAAANQVTDALTRLAMLDELDPDPTQAVFVRALGNELEVGRGRRGTFGTGVSYGPLTSAAGQDLDAVIIVGMAEGLCPSVRRDDSLLPDSARARGLPGELALRADRIHEQHRAYLAALAAAPEGRRVITHPRGSLRSRTANLPSRWLLDSASVVAGERIDSSSFARLGAPIVTLEASHADSVRSATVPLSLAERDLAQLAQLVDARADLAVHPATIGSAGRGIECLTARRSSAFTEWDGNLAGAPTPSPTTSAAPLSATGLQQWAVCGFRYFLSHVLHLRDRDDPERIRELNPLDRGSGVHEILERFLLEVLDTGAPEPHERWAAEQRQRLQAIAAEVFDEYERRGRTGRPVTWRVERARLGRMLDEFLTHDDTRRAEWESRPVRVELPFGLDDADPVIVDLPDGRAVHFRGLADRVDRTADGRWIVIDYKTGKGNAYKHLDVDPFAGGTTLQLGLYAEAARQRLGGDAAAAYYWMVDQQANYTPYGYEWTPDRRARFVELIATMVDGIEDGVFAAVPGELDHFRNTHEACAFCDFDHVCPSDRGVYATAKVDAPQLAIRRRLVPDPVEESP